MTDSPSHAHVILLNSLLCSAFSSAWQEMRPKAEDSVREKNEADEKSGYSFGGTVTFPAYLNLHCTNVKLSMQKHDCRPINVLGSVVRHHSQAKDVRVNAYSSYLPTDSWSQWINRPTPRAQLRKVKHCYSLNFRSSTNKRRASLIFIKITFTVEIYAQSRTNMGAGSRITDEGLFRLTLCWRWVRVSARLCDNASNTPHSFILQV